MKTEAERARHREYMRDWTRRKAADGLCTLCGVEKAAPERKRCDACAEIHRLRERRRRQNPDEKVKRVARQSVAKALLAGRVVKPLRCDDCGRVTGDLEAHHQAYTREMRRRVEWLCTVCHGKRHYKAA